jgi:hypothetical protein
MDIIHQYIDSIILGTSGVLISLVVTGIKSIHTRIRKLEDRIIMLEKDIETNSKLDELRSK